MSSCIDRTFASSYSAEYCSDETYNGSLFAQRIIQRPTNTYRIKAEGSATENVKEIQEVRLWSHQVIDISINASRGTWDLEFCQFDVQLPGTVYYAPVPNSANQISVFVSNNEDTTQVWQEAGVYEGYPVRVSKNSSVSGQDRQTYRVSFSECDGCYSSVIQLDQDYTGPTINGPTGTVWGCSWSLPKTTLNYNANANALRTAFENALGEDSVESVVRTVTSEPAGYVYRVVLAEGVVGAQARVNSTNLGGSDIGASAETIVLGASIGSTYATANNRSSFTGSFSLGFEDENSTSLNLSSSANQVQAALRNLTDIGLQLVVKKSSSGWTWKVTFGEAGDMPLLTPWLSSSATPGLTLKTVTTTVGLSLLDGSFQIMLENSNSSTIVPVTASAKALADSLASLDLSDASVTLSASSSGNEYEWIVGLDGNCPDNFDLSSEELYVTPMCNFSLTAGPSTSELLTGTNATLTVEHIFLLDLGESWRSQTVSWTEVARIPSDLPSSESVDGGYLLPLTLSQRGRYVFEASASTDTSVVIGTQLVYVDAGLPQIDVGNSTTSVAYPASQVELTGSASKALYGSTISSYLWTLVDSPSGASSSAGQISSPNSATTKISSLGVPGTFEYSLRVTDSLGLAACATKSIEVLFAPTIDHNLTNLDLIPGENIVLNCTASGSTPITYRWMFGNTTLTSTDAVLRYSSVAETDQGNYTCIASNKVSSVRSNTAFVNVYNPVVIASDPKPTIGVPGLNTSLLCSATGSFPMEVYWERQVEGSTTWTQYSRAAATSGNEIDATYFKLNINNLTEADQGNYRCIVGNMVNNATSNATYLDIMDIPSNVTISVSPASVLENGVNESSTENFTLACDSVGENVTYAIELNGVVVSEAQTHVFTNITATQHAGDYTCVATNGAGSAESESLEIVVNTPPIIITQPQSLTVNPGERAVFTVEAIGARPLAYLWMKDGDYISENNYTLANLTFEAAEEVNEGLYSVTVYNYLNVTQSVNVMLTVNDPPQIVSPTSNTTKKVDPGGTITLKCEANGTGPLSFTWLQDGDNDSGNLTEVEKGAVTSDDTSSQLVISNVATSDEGNYYCKVLSDIGEAISSAMRLDVNDPPTIVLSPLDVFAEPNSNVSFTVVVAGATPMSYQWRKDGIDIDSASATLSTLVLLNVTTADEGSYDCRATNHLNSVTGVLSDAANLHIARAPEIINQPINVTADPSKTATLSCTVSGAPPMTYKWYRRGVGGSDVVMQENVTSLAYFESILQIQDIKESEQGVYLLSVENYLGNVSSDFVSVTVNDPPVIISSEVTKTVDPGANVSFSCNVTADPAVKSVTWRHKSSSSSTSSTIVSGQTGFTLALTNVSQSDEGIYICYATNSAGSASKTVGKLSVRDPPTILSMSPIAEGGSLTVDPLQQVNLTVLASGIAPLNYTWYLNGAVSQTGNSPSFKFAPSEEGSIFVRVSNRLGSDTSIPITIAVNAPAQIDSVTMVPTDGRILTGGTAQLICKGSGSTPLTFTWLKDGSALDVLEDAATDNVSGTSSYTLSSEDDYTSQLLITDAVSTTHTGSYTCRVKNSAKPQGAISEALEVTVVLPPIINASTPEDMTRLPTYNSSFQCELTSGTPPFIVTWYYTESLGADIEAIEMRNSSMFSDAIGTYQTNAGLSDIVITIINSSNVDEGLYSCNVCNEADCAQSRWASLGVFDSPRITEQEPKATNISVETNPGDDLSLSVVASGLEPLTFQWYKYEESSDITQAVIIDGDAYRQTPSNCTEANVPCILLLNDIHNSAAGSYYCVVSNSLGMTSSVAIDVNVTKVPTLEDASTWPDTLRTACPGNVFEQEVNISGTSPIHYAWYFSSTYSEASSIFTSTAAWQTTDPIFKIADPDNSNEGYYAFIATNVAGAYRSSAARLDVNEGPTAAADAAGSSPRHSVTLPRTYTQLYASASKNAIKYSWEVVSHPTLESGRVQLTSPTNGTTGVLGMTVAGEYIFRLTVTGAYGCTNSDEVTVVVNTAPVAVAPNATVSLESYPAQLDGRASYDIDSGGSIVSYRWSLASVDGSVEAAESVALVGSNTSIVRVTEPVVGLYAFVLAVTDNDGATTTIRTYLNVLDVTFISPVAPVLAPFIKGGYYEHLVIITVKGYLPGGGSTPVRLSFENVANSLNATSTTVISTTLEKLQGSSSSSDEKQVLYQWAVDERTEPGLGNLQVVIGADTQTTTQSDQIEVVLPYHFESISSNDCDCSSEPQQNRNVRCVGYGIGAAFASYGSESYAWMEIEHDISKCLKFSPLPVSKIPCTSEQVEECSSLSTHWNVSSWSIGEDLDQAAFCASQICGTERTRTVNCIDAGSSIVSTSRCSSATPETTQICSTGCLDATMRFMSVVTGASSNSCSPVWYRSAPNMCFERASGYLLGTPKCDSVSTLSSDILSTSLCTDVWSVSDWVCDRTTNIAQRSAQCITYSTGESSSTCSSTSRPNLTQACVPGTVISSTSQLPYRSIGAWYYWSIGAWGNCTATTVDIVGSCSLMQQERDVLCVNRYGEVTADLACANLTKPYAVQTCSSSCVETCQTNCGPHGRCDNAAASTCVCDKGWSGEDCSETTNETICIGDEQVLDINGGCCDLSSATLTAQGTCCSTGVLDFEGSCCASGSIDACGSCNGAGITIDAQGKCCETLLDAEGLCCLSGLLDRCGICDGTGSSCSASVSIVGLYSSTLEASLREDQQRLDVEVSLIEELTTNMPRNVSWSLISAEVSTTTTKERRILSNEGSLSGDILTVNAKVELAPSSMMPWLRISNQSTWTTVLKSVLNVSSATTLAVGYCGNDVCEVGERCTDKGCCPSDCVLPEAVLWCPLNCSGHGVCHTGLGRCVCQAGYSGEACTECSGDARMTSQGTCIPTQWIPISNMADSSDGDTSGATNTITEIVKKSVFWPGFIFGLLFTCCLTSALVGYARHKYRQIRDETNLQLLMNNSARFGPSVNPLRLSSMQNAKKGFPFGWLWKRSENGYNGQQIWQHWYASKQGLDIFYYNNDTEAWSEGNSKSHLLRPQELGRLNLRHVEAVLVKGKKSAKHGGWRFDLLYRLQEREAQHGYADIEDGMSTRSSLDEEAVDALDYPHVRHRYARNQPRDRSMGLQRVEFMCDTQHAAMEWAEAIAESTGARLQCGRSVQNNTKPNKDERVVIELASIASPNASKSTGLLYKLMSSPQSVKSPQSGVSTDSIASSLPGMVIDEEPSVSTCSSSGTSVTSVSGVQGLIVGTLSGALGYRVACEGWVRLEVDKSSVYGTLFPERDELAIFETMVKAKDGAHHYAGKLRSIKLSRVAEVQGSASKLVTIKFWDRKHTEKLQSLTFATSPEEQVRWCKALKDHMHFRHGVDVYVNQTTEKVELDNPGMTLLQAAEPPKPIGRITTPINEKLSSLRVRRSSSVLSRYHAELTPPKLSSGSHADTSVADSVSSIEETSSSLINVQNDNRVEYESGPSKVLSKSSTRGDKTRGPPYRPTSVISQRAAKRSETTSIGGAVSVEKTNQEHSRMQNNQEDIEMQIV